MRTGWGRGLLLRWWRSARKVVEGCRTHGAGARQDCRSAPGLPWTALPPGARKSMAFSLRARSSRKAHAWLAARWCTGFVFTIMTRRPSQGLSHCLGSPTARLNKFLENSLANGNAKRCAIRMRNPARPLVLDSASGGRMKPANMPLGPDGGMGCDAFLLLLGLRRGAIHRLRHRKCFLVVVQGAFGLVFGGSNQLCFTLRTGPCGAAHDPPARGPSWPRPWEPRGAAHRDRVGPGP